MQFSNFDKNLLDKIHNKIRISTNTKIGKKLIIYLGDYIDRGPDVKGTIDTLINFNLPKVEKIFLLGNHEQMFLDVLEGKNNSLYNSNLATFDDDHGAYDHKDAQGFIALNALRLKNTTKK